MSSSWYAVPPNAPLLKDSDSFTDGTGHSTFDFPLPPSAGGELDIDPSGVYQLVYHPPEDPEDDRDEDGGLGMAVTPNQPVTYTNSLALQLLPLEDPKDAVRAWIEGVSAMSHLHQPQVQTQSTSYHSPHSQYHYHDYNHHHHQSSQLQPHPHPLDEHDDLADSTGYPRKRRRSLTANSDAEAQARRVRAWIPTVEPSYAPRFGARKGAYSKQRQEHEAPD